MSWNPLSAFTSSQAATKRVSKLKLWQENQFFLIVFDYNAISRTKKQNKNHSLHKSSWNSQVTVTISRIVETNHVYVCINGAHVNAHVWSLVLDRVKSWSETEWSQIRPPIFWLMFTSPKERVLKIHCVCVGAPVCMLIFIDYMERSIYLTWQYDDLEQWKTKLSYCLFSLGPQ